MVDNIKQILAVGENVAVEFKRCGNGADPIFIEGDQFTVSVSLKKLDDIRFPFEKPSIGSEKPSIDALLLQSGLSRPTRTNIGKLVDVLADGEVFGRSRIMEICGLSYGPAGDLLNTMLRNGFLDSVKGFGKGKYRFRI